MTLTSRLLTVVALGFGAVVGQMITAQNWSLAVGMFLGGATYATIEHWIEKRGRIHGDDDGQPISREF